MARFRLDIELGNDAVRTYKDVGRLLQRLGLQFLEKNEKMNPPEEKKVFDINGNSIGVWEVVSDDPGDTFG